MSAEILADAFPSGRESHPAEPLPATAACAPDFARDRWSDVVGVLRRHYHEPDVQAARALYSAYAAHDLSGQCVWPMLVAPPGSMKTELIRALDGLPRTHSIDSLTSKTFISGQIRDPLLRHQQQRASSLLHRIGRDGIVLCPDFSTVLSTRAEDRDAIFADMRRIFDGELRKEFGTSEAVPIWKGRITFVVAVTQEIDKLHKVIQRLGDRFVMIRMRRAGLEAARVAMRQNLEESRRDLSAAVSSLLSDLPQTDIALSSEMTDCLAALAEFAVRARTHVPREGIDKSVVGAPEAESATRLSQQLCQLAKGSARLSHRSQVDEDDFLIAKRVAFDCIPARRRSMLDKCMGGSPVLVNTSTDQYDRDDLMVVGLMAGSDLSPLAKDLLAQATPDHHLTRLPPQASDQQGQKPGGNIREVVAHAEAVR